MSKGTIEKNALEINLSDYLIPPEVKCARHGKVKPEARVKNGKAAALCPKGCFVQWLGRPPAQWSRKELATALKDLPHKSAINGHIIPEPTYTELLLVDTSCLGCMKTKATYLVQGWTRHLERIRMFICTACKYKLEKLHAERKQKYRRD